MTDSARQRACNCGWLIPRDLESNLTISGPGARLFQPGDVFVNAIIVVCPVCGMRWKAADIDDNTEKKIG